MLSVGLDLHKRYSQVEALGEDGERRSAARLVNEFEEIERFFRSLGEPCRVVLEAGWNWGSMYDWLERVENVVEVQLAHPYGVRAIAAAQVKTDRIDARMLGQLLRVGLIPRAYIPGRETRQLREAVRQRLFLVRVRTKAGVGSVLQDGKLARSTARRCFRLVAVPVLPECRIV